jgi:hypothetical protein
MSKCALKCGYLHDHEALEMAKPDGIYGPLSNSANGETGVRKLGDHPASGLNISIPQPLTAFNGVYGAIPISLNRMKLPSFSALLVFGLARNYHWSNCLACSFYSA